MSLSIPPQGENKKGRKLRLASHSDFQPLALWSRLYHGLADHGFTFAGNFAFLSLLAIFSFFLSAATIAAALGQTSAGREFFTLFMQTVPPTVANALQGPISEALTARTGVFIWLSVITGIWTTTSLIETVRDILYQAYEEKAEKPFWRYRLSSIILVVGSIFTAMLALSSQVFFASLNEVLASILPQFAWSQVFLLWTTIFPFLIIFVTLFLSFHILSPPKYRTRKFHKWPGAALTSLWWVFVTQTLPTVLGAAGRYALAYGSLAGVIITLIFFYLIGLGIVVGAHLNASLIAAPDNGSR